VATQPSVFAVNSRPEVNFHLLIAIEHHNHGHYDGCQGPRRHCSVRYKEVGVVSYDSDILARGLDVIFCGLNPASSAAVAGHNFSNGTNRFWTVLHLAGFTDVRLQPQDERSLLAYGCGITAVVSRPTKRAAEVSPEEFRQARLGFEAKMRHYAPRSIAFLGKRALSVMIGRPDVGWGRLPTEFAGMMAWLLPNPSGLNRGFTRDALVSAYAEFRIALAIEAQAPQLDQQ
jgi:double-stranded uracil-DNA glycosylase